MHTYTGPSEPGGHLMDPHLQCICGHKQMIIFGRIKPFPCKNIKIALQTGYIVPVQDSVLVSVGEQLFIGQVTAGGFLVE